MIYFSVCLLVTLSSIEVKGQQSLYFQERSPDFREAMELFQKEKYYAAQTYFEKSIEQIEDPQSEMRIDAEYYRAICAIELFHDNAAVLLQNFIEAHPESAHIQSAYFNLAKFQFRKRHYRDVILYLSAIDPIDLEEGDYAEYFFKKGYAYFQLEEFDLAANNFYEIKDRDNDYIAAARYYYAHIAYQNKNYQTAATDFKKIAEDPQFGALVPYYLTQIYYLQGKYDQLLSYAPDVLKTAPPKREEEIRKLIGDAYYKTAQYREAVPYLEAYMKRHNGTEKDHYQLGYAYYRLKNYDKAIEAFKDAIRENDTLAQSAYYYIGESSIQIGKKAAARAAFRNAYKLGIDEFLTEDALFNYAKVAYELSYHPYNDAILAFEEYINTYPNSKKLKSAYEYLVGVYYTTKNYKEALRSIERIKTQDIKLLEAKQRLAFYRGVELFNQKDYQKAKALFKLSLENNYSPKLKASAEYWIGESNYHLKNYKAAGERYEAFLSSSGARSLDFFEKGYYNIAYVYYELRDYSSATFWFREYIDRAKKKNKGLINDAYLRLGDSYFIQKKYREAVDYYQKSAGMKLKDSDYAALQAAISNGVLGNYKSKASQLKTLVKEHKASTYLDDALFELGKTYLALDKNEDALAYYNRLIDKFPNSNYLAEAYLKVGLIHYNRKEDDLALNAFDNVVQKFPASIESREALEKVRRIYIDKGDATAYEDYISGVSFADVSKAKLDSTAYTIAENNYLSGNCDKASRDFTNYLNRYPNGIFSLNAHYYRAYCEMQSNFEQEAVQDFEKVVMRAPNKFLEKTLFYLGPLYRSLQQPDSAIATYKKLIGLAERQDHIDHAKVALMEIYMAKEDYENASTYAKEILNREMVERTLWQKAQMVLAKTYLKKEEIELANVHLDTLSRLNTKLAAEAKYLLAKNYHQEGDYARSDTNIYRLLNQVPAFPYWVAKSFILLADNFVAKEDLYNAKLTLKSVIENAEDTTLVEIANEKLTILKSSEKVEEKEKKPIEIDMYQLKEENKKEKKSKGKQEKEEQNEN